MNKNGKGGGTSASRPRPFRSGVLWGFPWYNSGLGFTTSLARCAPLVASGSYFFPFSGLRFPLRTPASSPHATITRGGGPRGPQIGRRLGPVAKIVARIKGGDIDNEPGALLERPCVQIGGLGACAVFLGNLVGFSPARRLSSTLSLAEDANEIPQTAKWDHYCARVLR